MKETWKEVRGYEDLYEVSDGGNVRNKKTGRQLKPELTQNGYLRVTLSKNGKLKHYKIHRLVGQAFIKNDDPETKNQVDHKNGVKTDNKMSNLRGVTAKENNNHRRNNKKSNKIVITIEVEVK